MRLDIVTIFPAYLDPLGLSLAGRARERGLLEVAVHDLREWTDDRHRTVDDTPAGGGAGMVMTPEPWGRALDQLCASDERAGRPTIVVPTPAGTPFTQQTARALAGRERLVFVCGRYEGIDQRVLDHAATLGEVQEISLGDYVLNGGEVAALAIAEAVVRLLPGVVGNPASLDEESHEGGLLEYPVYTRPARWRDREVPAVLLSGDHAAIARWRREQSLLRTTGRRPDLLPATAAPLDGAALPIVRATRADAAELLVLQRACWVQEAIANDSLGIPALHESLETVARGIQEQQTWVVRSAGRLVASVRGRLDDDEWDIGRLMVAPDQQGRGLGRVLLEHIQRTADPAATAYRLFTGSASVENLRMYTRAGFRVRGHLPDDPGVTVLVKPRRAG